MSEILPREIFYTVIDNTDDFTSIGRLLRVSSWLAKYITGHADKIADRFVTNDRTEYSWGVTDVSKLPNGAQHGITSVSKNWRRGFPLTASFKLGKKHGRLVERYIDGKKISYFNNGVDLNILFVGVKISGSFNTVTITRKKVYNDSDKLRVKFYYKETKCDGLDIKYKYDNGRKVSFTASFNDIPEAKEKLLLPWFEKNVNKIAQEIQSQ